MKLTYQKLKITAMALALCTLFGFCACTGGGEVADTILTDALTDPTTEETLTSSFETDAQTQENTVLDETQGAETEAQTNAPEIVLPEDAPKQNNLITFCDFEGNQELFSGKAYTAEIVKDEDGTSVLKLATDGDSVRGNYFRLDYAMYMNYAGIDPIDWNGCGYAIVTLKVENVNKTAFEIILKGQQEEDTFQSKGTSSYSKTKKDWQTICVPFDLNQKEDAILSEMRIFFAKEATSAGETVYIKSIALTSDRAEMAELMGESVVNPIETTLVIPGLKNNYKFLHVTDLHASAFSTEETKTMDANRINLITARRNAFKGGSFYSEERMPYLFGYADKIEADLLLLSGDLLDFPSQKNVALLADNIHAIKTPAFYVLGNHDWCYGDSDYFSQNAIQNQIPLFKDMSVGEPKQDTSFHYVEYEDLLVVAVDNSQDMVTKSTVDKFLALYEKNKPIILMLHVPMHVDTLVADSKKVWGKDLGMGAAGTGGVSAWHPENDVDRFYNAVCIDENSPVVAVVAGHVHFNHEDVFPNGVPQYITTESYSDGECRIINVKGEA